MSKKKAISTTSTVPKIKSIWTNKPEPSKGKSGNQHRLILGISGSQIYYASRGENVKNKFNLGKKCQIERFLNNSLYSKMAKPEEWKQATNDLAAWIEAQDI